MKFSYLLTSLLASAVSANLPCNEYTCDFSKVVDVKDDKVFKPAAQKALGLAQFSLINPSTGDFHSYPVIEKAGGDQVSAFVSSCAGGKDKITSDSTSVLGHYFLRTLGLGNGEDYVPSLLINYPTNITVNTVSGSIYDIDGAGYRNDGSFHAEEWTVIARDIDEHEIDRVKSPRFDNARCDTSLDSRAWDWSFDTKVAVSSVEMRFTGTGSPHFIGLAFDNLAFEACDAPTPPESGDEVRECSDFVITVNGQSTDKELDFDDSLGFLDLKIVSSHDTNVSVKFHSNHAHLYTSSCGFSAVADELSTVSLTSSLIRGQPNENDSSVIRLKYGHENKCFKDVKVNRAPKGKGKCSSIGDPHTVTLDNARHDWGSNDFVTIFQGCDLMILGDHRLTDMQREVPLVDGADGETILDTLSMYQGLKFQYKNTLISVILDDANIPHVYSESIDGKQQENILFREKVHRFIFELPDGSIISIHIRGNESQQTYLDINLAVSPRYKQLCSGVTTLTGVCGNWNGDKSDDGFTVNNVSPNGPWNSVTYEANANLPETNFPTNIAKLRCTTKDKKQVFVDSFPEPTAVDTRRRSVKKATRRNIEDEEAFQKYLNACEMSAETVDPILTEFFDTCDFNVQLAIKNCAIDMMVGAKADIPHQAEMDLEHCPDYEEFLKSKQVTNLKTIIQNLKN